MRVRLTWIGRDDGAVAVTVALMLVALLGIAAFTLDLGMAYAQRQALSTGADSAALAVVRDSYEKVVLNNALTCTDLQTSGQSANAATNQALIRAIAQVNANAPFGESLSSSAIRTPILSCDGGSLQADVTVTKDVGTYFGRLLGIDTLTVGRTARANLAVVNEVSGYLPIAICVNQAQAVIDNAKTDAARTPPQVRHEKIELNKVWKDVTQCGSGGSGNWGWLYCTSNGSSKLADTILDGCPNPLTLNAGSPPSISMGGTPGDKGNSQNVSNAMTARMDDVLAVPVYDQVTGSGSNATYRVVGFLSLRLCAYAANKSATPGACYHSGIEPLSGLDVTVDKHDDAMQVQFVKYTPVGDLSTVCGLGNTTCAFNSYVMRLTR